MLALFRQKLQKFQHPPAGSYADAAAVNAASQSYLGVIKACPSQRHLVKGSCGLVQASAQHCLVCANYDEGGRLIHLQQ